MFLSEWREFSLKPCLSEKKIDDSSRLDVAEIARVPDMLSFSLCYKKRLAIRYMNRPLFPTTLSIPFYDREVCRAKDLSAPPRIFIYKRSILEGDIHITWQIVL